MTTNTLQFYGDVELANVTLDRVMLEHGSLFERYSPFISERQRARDIAKKCQCDTCIRFQQADTVRLI